jgi:hypothetical protein
VSRRASALLLLLTASFGCQSRLSREDIVGRYNGEFVGEVGVLDLHVDGTLEWVGKRPDGTSSRRTGAWEFKHDGRTPLVILSEKEVSSSGEETQHFLYGPISVLGQVRISTDPDSGRTLQKQSRSRGR